MNKSTETILNKLAQLEQSIESGASLDLSYVASIKEAIAEIKSLDLQVETLKRDNENFINWPMPESLEKEARGVGSITGYGLRTDAYIDIDGSDLWLDTCDFPQETLWKVNFLVTAANYVVGLAKGYRRV